MIHIRRKISTYTIEVDLIDFHPKTFVIPSAIAALTIENTFETIGDKLKFEFTPDIDPDVVIRFMERIGCNTSEVTISNEVWERTSPNGFDLTDRAEEILVGRKVILVKDLEPVVFYKGSVHDIIQTDFDDPTDDMQYRIGTDDCKLWVRRTNFEFINK